MQKISKNAEMWKSWLSGLFSTILIQVLYNVKWPVNNGQFLVPTNHFFEVTLVNYIPLAFRKGISYVVQFFTVNSLSKELW